MRRKSLGATNFMGGLRAHVEKHLHRPKRTAGTSEASIQAEYQSIFREFLEGYFREKGCQRVKEKVKGAFYWEGADDINDEKRRPLFGSRNYPDFVIKEPYRVAIEYKQSPSGSLVKQGIGQALMHTLNEEYDFVYLLFHDQTKEKKVLMSMKNEREVSIKKVLWKDFNVMLHIV